MKLIKTILPIVFLLSQSACSQQAPDNDYRFPNPDPAYSLNTGPRVCIDESHYNFHTANGRYKPFATLLEDDGYQVSRFKQIFSQKDLTANCDILVIANALGAQNKDDWHYPHFPAFTGAEIEAVMLWISSGGKLMLIADHPPFSGAASDLGAALGLIMADIYGINEPMGLDVFSTFDGSLHEHPITRGRNSDETINGITTFTGQPVQITQGWQPLVTYGTKAIGMIANDQIYRTVDPSAEPYTFSISGWVHLAAKELDEGRIIFSGEAAMCTAQLTGMNRRPMGMNSLQAPTNAQFCLNMLHWLSGKLD